MTRGLLPSFPKCQPGFRVFVKYAKHGQKSRNKRMPQAGMADGSGDACCSGGGMAGRGRDAGSWPAPYRPLQAGLGSAVPLKPWAVKVSRGFLACSISYHSFSIFLPFHPLFPGQLSCPFLRIYSEVLGVFPNIYLRACHREKT